MGWSWQYQDATGASTGSSQSFANQADAESWIGETWRELLDGGVEAVVLLDEQREVYGPMGLRPAD